MTGQEIRDIGYLAWKDPWAWMETMKGKRWNKLIENEKKHYYELTSQPSVKRRIKQMEKEIIQIQQYVSWDGLEAAGGAIHIRYDALEGMCWKWAWKKRWIPIDVFDVHGQVIVFIVNDRLTYENTMYCQRMDGTILWKKKDVSSSIAIIGSRCYYVRGDSVFNASDLYVCDVETGRHEQILYRERDQTRDLMLVRGANRTLYLVSKSTTHSSLFRVNEATLTPLHQKANDHIPLGQITDGEDCVLIRAKEDKEWVAKGKPVTDWNLPSEEIVWVNLSLGHCLTIHEGSQTVWLCQPNKRPKSLFSVPIGTIEAPTWSNWESSMIQTYLVKTPEEPPYIIDIMFHQVIKRPRTQSISHPLTLAPLEVHRFHTVSKDHTKVPYIVVKQARVRAKAELVYVYGAYGDSTPVSWPYQSWYPLLSRGWAIVFALVRGGGDVDAAWAAAARRENRHVSVDDFEAVVRASQNKLQLGPTKTVIYGRSAGGVPVGATVARYPGGELMGAAFTEVPYVDVLRTSTNPDLPLTVGEYDEFGNPREKILNFQELLSVSPINSLSTEGAPGVFVLSHVGLLDRQVYAYESFKWIQRLRGVLTPEQMKEDAPKGKYVTFEKSEAHVYRPKKMPRFRAMDLAVLDAWVDGELAVE